MTQEPSTSDGDSTAPSVAKQWDVPFFKDTDKFIEAYKAGTLKADAIILATPTHTHVPLTKELLGTGLAVLIEKPVATSAAEGRDLLRACQDNHIGIYMVGHHRRHHAQVRAVKHTVDSGVLGTVIAVNGGLCFTRKALAWYEQSLTCLCSMDMEKVGAIF